MLRRFRGVTLVELMISLLLGSLLIGAMLSLLTTQRNAAQQIHATAAMSERMAFAATFFSRHLMEAGFAPLTHSAPSPVSFVGKRSSLDDAWGDTLVIQSDGGHGCTDDELPDNNGIEWRRFSLYRDGDKQELRCEDSEGGPYPMLDGVESMQVQYGIDINQDRAPDFYANAGTAGKVLSTGSLNSANKQTTTNNSASASKQAHVVSIRVGLLLRSESAIFDRTKDNSSKMLLDNVFSSNSKNGSDFGDGRLRRSMVVTVALRNLES